MLTQTMIDAAESVKAQLATAVRDLELALERDGEARRRYSEAKQDYSDAEAEIRFEAVHTAEGKNAEQRGAAADRMMIEARTAGTLSPFWSRMLAAQSEADAAKIALEQMSKRYRAIEAVAELTTAQLRALSR